MQMKLNGMLLPVILLPFGVWRKNYRERKTNGGQTLRSDRESN